MSRMDESRHVHLRVVWAWVVSVSGVTRHVCRCVSRVKHTDDHDAVVLRMDGLSHAPGRVMSRVICVHVPGHVNHTDENNK